MKVGDLVRITRPSSLVSVGAVALIVGESSFSAPGLVGREWRLFRVSLICCHPGRGPWQSNLGYYAKDLELAY